MTSARKTIIVILGAGATGKSTLTRKLSGDGGLELTHNLAVKDPETGEEEIERVKYTLFPALGLSVAGNMKNGSDSISRMENLNKVIGLCLMEVPSVIVDGVRSSQKFVDWVHEHPEKPCAIFVYFNLSLEENEKRLLTRRQGNGKLGVLPEKTYNNMLEFRKRAERVWNYARENYKRSPVGFVEIEDDTDMELVVNTVRTMLSQFHGENHGSNCDKSTLHSVEL